MNLDIVGCWTPFELTFSLKTIKQETFQLTSGNYECRQNLEIRFWYKTSDICMDPRGLANDPWEPPYSFLITSMGIFIKSPHYIHWNLHIVSLYNYPWKFPLSLYNTMRIFIWSPYNNIHSNLHIVFLYDFSYLVLLKRVSHILESHHNTMQSCTVMHQVL